jgi:hypothetical protein
MVGTRLKRRIWRRIAALALAYALALSGFFGALASPTQAAEARLAAQLGLICTIHGMVGQGDAQDGADPTPGRMACVEHCAASASGAMPPVPLRPLGSAAEPGSLLANAAASEADPAFPRAAPPPGRGPPASI